LADALEGAFSVMIQCLSPIERAVFLLREVFECDYSDIARIVGRSDENCRQILRRARQRIAGRDARFDVSSEEQEMLLREFLRATEDGDFDGLADALAKDATLIPDGSDLGATAPPPVSGAEKIRDYLTRRCGELFPANANLQRTFIEGVPILLVFSERKLVSALRFAIENGKFQTIHSITCPFRLRVLSAQCLLHNYNENNNYNDDREL
jgi:RNA polymerase sigma-70 factor (ECF subfamily)